jgi:hypothetical protein
MNSSKIPKVNPNGIPVGVVWFFFHPFFCLVLQKEFIGCRPIHNGWNGSNYGILLQDIGGDQRKKVVPRLITPYV